jgi:hypothetical protein
VGANDVDIDINVENMNVANVVVANVVVANIVDQKRSLLITVVIDMECIIVMAIFQQPMVTIMLEYLMVIMGIGLIIMLDIGICGGNSGSENCPVR